MNKTCSCGQSWPYRLTCLLENCAHRVSIGIDFIAVNTSGDTDKSAGLGSLTCMSALRFFSRLHVYLRTLVERRV
jgi:hypothetical protein